MTTAQSPDARGACAYAYERWLADWDDPHRCLPLMIFGGRPRVWGWMKNWHDEDVRTPMCQRGPAATSRSDRCAEHEPPAAAPPPTPWWLTRPRHG